MADPLAAALADVLKSLTVAERFAFFSLPVEQRATYVSLPAAERATFVAQVAKEERMQRAVALIGLLSCEERIKAFLHSTLSRIPSFVDLVLAEGQTASALLQIANGYQRSVWRDGLPSLVESIRSSPSRTAGRKKKSATLVVDEQMSKYLLRELTTPVISSSVSIWATSVSGCLSWSSEASIQGHVKIVVQELLNSIGLSQILCELELTVLHFRPDIWLLLKSRKPIGVLEIKKPKPPGMLDSDLVHGQMFDYLMMLRGYFGVLKPFGIVTTYDGWRPYWLPENFDGSERKVCGGSVIRPLDRDTDVTALPTMFCNVVNEMIKSSSNDQPDDASSQLVVVYDVDSYTWARRFEVNTNVDAILPPDINRVCVLQAFGAGLHGRAFKVAANNGTIGVIKFALGENSLHDEANAWRQAYDDKYQVRVAKFVGSSALVMPFVHVAEVVSDEDANKAALRLAARGIRHDDFRGRHIGTFGGELVAFDFGDVTQIDCNDPVAVNNAVKCMMDAFNADKADENRSKRSRLQ
jgi:hypothetical protein